MAEINLDELIDFQTVHLDMVGDIYEYQGKIIRIINRKYNKQTRKILERGGLAEELIKNNLFIDTRISELHYPGSDIVLEHRKIAVKQHYSQWTFEMMKDAALLVLRINTICEKYGYELKDCHQSNILFDGVRPIWIDFGSIVRKREKGKWIAQKEFMKSYYFPLLLWSKGFDGIVNSLYKSFTNVNIDELISINYYIPLKIVSKFINNLNFRQFNPYKIFHRICNLGIKKKSYWGNYQDNYWNKSNKRFDYELDWIKDNNEDIESMVEIGANQGVFSYLVAQKTNINKIIATDYDQEAVNAMYNKMKSENLNKITPLVLDFVWTSCNELKNYQCDLLVANALTHHLLLTQGMTMEAMLEKLSILTKKYIIVEFMPKGVNRTHLPNWYTEKWFLQSLSKKFELLKINNESSGRTIIIAQKK